MAMQQHSDNQGMSYREPLILDLDAELMRRIRFAAARNRQSVDTYVEKALDQIVPNEADTQETQTQKKLSTEAINDLVRIREEIMKAHPGVIYDSVETLRQLREERDRELEQR